MAAHLVVDFPISSEKTAFTGTAEDDSSYLKIFWQSVHLNPTIESRLVSSNVKQRLKPASTKHNSDKQSYKFREDDPPQLVDYQKKVFVLESEDQHNKRLRQLERREANLGRLKRRELTRNEVQSASRQQIIHREPPAVLPPITTSYDDVLDAVDIIADEVQQTFADIDAFDKKIALSTSQGKAPVDENSFIS